MFDCVVYCWRLNEMASYNEADHHNHRSNIDYMYLFRTQWSRVNKRLHPPYPVGCNYLSMSYSPSFPTHILSMMTSSNGNVFRVTDPLCTKVSDTDVFIDLRLNKRSSKQSRRWWFETPSRSLWRLCNETSPSCRLCFSGVLFTETLTILLSIRNSIPFSLLLGTKPWLLTTSLG